MAFVGFADVMFQIDEGIDLGDTLDMAGKAFENKIIALTVDISDPANKLSHTVGAGKIFYFHAAKIVITGNPLLPGINQTTNNIVQADLIIDGVPVDTTHIGFQARNAQAPGTVQNQSGTSYGNIGDGRFDVKGRTAEAGKIIEIENTVDGGAAIATLIGFEEDTLVDPRKT